MADRRPHRTRKEVDYAKLTSCNDEDDFENFTPPISKKPKKEKKNDRSKLKPKEPIGDEDFSVIFIDDDEIKPVKTRRKPTQRKSLDDKVYERELQLALEISKQDCSQSDSNKEANESINPSERRKESKLSVDTLLYSDNKQTDSSMVPENRLTDKILTDVDSEQIDSSNPVIVEGDKCEELVTNDFEETVGRSKRGSTRKRKYVSSDEEESDSGASDFDEQLASEPSDSESDFNPESDDSDFAAKSSKSKKKTAKKPVAKKAPKASKMKCTAAEISTGDTQSSLVNSKASEAKPRSSSVTAKSKSESVVKFSGTDVNVAKSVLSDNIKKVPNKSSALKKSPFKSGSSFKPVTPRTTGLVKSSGQCQSPYISQGNCTQPPLGGVQIKSPTSGGLRLGLSRNTRVKPLHSNVKVPL